MAVAERLVLFHRVAVEEVVEARRTADGEVLWSTAYTTTYRDDFGFDEGPRTPPTVAAGRVFTFGAQGVLQALDLETGNRLWSVDTKREFDVDKGFFGAACAPLVEGDRVMVNVGSRKDAGIVAFDVATGEVAWKATDDEMSYASPVLATLRGERAALFFTREGLVEVDPRTGDVRTEFRWRSRSRSSVNAASPLVVGGRVFLSASYGTGAVFLDRTEEGFEPVWSSDDSLSTHYATAVHHEGTLYGFHGALHLGPPSLRAIAASSGEVAWNQDRFGGGSIVLVDDRLLIVRDNGEIVVADATADEFRPLARYRILPGTIRAYPALSRGTLYLRDESQLVAIDLREQEAG